MDFPKRLRTQMATPDETYLHMTDTQRKEMARIDQRIKSLKRTISTEEEIAKEIPLTSYLFEKAQESVQFNRTRLEKLHEEYKRMVPFVEEKLANAEAFLQRETQRLEAKRKSKTLIKAEIELKELEQQSSDLFGTTDSPEYTLRPSSGFSSVAEEVAEMNRQQMIARQQPPLARRIEEWESPEEIALREMREADPDVQEARRRAAPPLPPVALRPEPEIPKPTKKPVKRVIKKEVAPGVRLYGECIDE